MPVYSLDWGKGGDANRNAPGHSHNHSSSCPSCSASSSLTSTSTLPPFSSSSPSSFSPSSSSSSSLSSSSLSTIGLIYGCDMDPVAAGCVAGISNFFTQRCVQRWYHWKNSTVEIAVPRIRSTVPAVTVYFTMYEFFKRWFGVESGELGYSQHVRHQINKTQQIETKMEGDTAIRQDTQVTTQIIPHAGCRGPFTWQRTFAYFSAASSAGACANLTSLFINRIPLWYSNLNTIQSPSPSAFRHGGPLSYLNVAALASLTCTALRFGIQFSIFEQCKNLAASYHSPGVDLSVGEVFATATIGGVVAVTAVHPLQRQIACRLPCGLPSSFTCSMVPKLPISKKSLQKCMIRFLPTCVVTATTYEFAARGIRAMRGPEWAGQMNFPLLQWNGPTAMKQAQAQHSGVGSGGRSGTGGGAGGQGEMGSYPPPSWDDRI